MQHMDQEEIRKVFSSFGMNQQQQLYTRNGKTVTPHCVDRYPF